VDLERSGVVDLLPERSAESFAAWLAQHPEIEFISRDRQGLYADGAGSGAPQAQQIADRFHLALDLRTAVEQELARHRSFLSLPQPAGQQRGSLRRQWFRLGRGDQPSTHRARATRRQAGTV
jgi:transposase